MIPKDTSGPAFHIPGLRQNETFTGMSLRDYFAAHVIQSFLSPHPVTGQYAQVSDFKYCAYVAYKMADAMLKERAE